MILRPTFRRGLDFIGDIDTCAAEVQRFLQHYTVQRNALIVFKSVFTDQGQHDRTGQRTLRDNRLCRVRACRSVKFERIRDVRKQTHASHIVHSDIADADRHGDANLSFRRERIVEITFGIERSAVFGNGIRTDSRPQTQFADLAGIKDSIICFIAERIRPLTVPRANIGKAHAVIGVEPNVEHQCAPVDKYFLDLRTDLADPAPVLLGIDRLPHLLPPFVQLVRVLHFRQHHDAVIAGFRLCGRNRAFDIGNDVLILFAFVLAVHHVARR